MSSDTSSRASVMLLEAKSARDGAWFDLHSVLSYRSGLAGSLEVKVRFEGFDAKDDEWVDTHSALRQRSVPCDDFDCVNILREDLVLCFQEGANQALHYDADVLDVKRRRHDARGCRCRFLIRYRHDGTMDSLPINKICRRPETEFRVRFYKQQQQQRVSTTEDMEDVLHLPVIVEPITMSQRDVVVDCTHSVEMILANSDLVVVTSEGIPQAIIINHKKRMGGSRSYQVG